MSTLNAGFGLGLHDHHKFAYTLSITFRLVMAPNKSYITSALSWGATPREIVEIRTAAGTRLAVFPPEFLIGSPTDSWQYILHVLDLLLEDAAVNPHFMDDDSNSVSMDTAVRSGTFLYIHRCMFELQYEINTR